MMNDLQCMCTNFCFRSYGSSGLSLPIKDFSVADRAESSPHLLHVHPAQILLLYNYFRFSQLFRPKLSSQHQGLITSHTRSPLDPVPKDYKLWQ